MIKAGNRVKFKLRVTTTRFGIDDFGKRIAVTENLGWREAGTGTVLRKDSCHQNHWVMKADHGEKEFVIFEDHMLKI